MTSPGPVGVRRAGLPRSLARTAVVLAAVTVVARAAGFGRTVVFSRVVGRTCLGSVYAAANGVPNIVFEIAAGGALSAVVVPLLARGFAANDLAGASRTASALLTWTLLVLVPLTVVAAVLARPIVSALLGPATGCDRAAAVAVGTRMLLVFVIQMVFYGVGIVVGGVLQAAGRFLGPALAPLLSSLVVVAAYLIYGAGGSRVQSGDMHDLSVWREAVLAGGTTLGVVALSLPLLLPLRRLGVRLRPTLRFTPGDARSVVALAGAGLAAVAAQQFATALVIRLCSGVQADSYVVVLLASTVFLLPWAVLAVPVATGVFPRLVVADTPSELVAAAAPALRAVVVLMCAGVALLVATARPVAAVLLLGAPGHVGSAPDALTRAITAFAPGLLGYGVWAVAARVLFARRGWAMASVATVAGWVVVMAADLALVAGSTGETIAQRMGVGQSIGLSVSGVAAVVGVRRLAGTDVLAGLGRAVAMGAVAAGVAGAAGRAVAGLSAMSSLESAVAVGTLAAVTVVVVFGGALALADRRQLPAAWRSVRARG